MWRHLLQLLMHSSDTQGSLALAQYCEQPVSGLTYRLVRSAAFIKCKRLTHTNVEIVAELKTSGENNSKIKEEANVNTFVTQHLMSNR